MGGCLTGLRAQLWNEAELQVSVFRRLLVSVYVTEQFTAASKGRTRLLSWPPHRGVGGAGRHSWNELKPTYRGPACSPDAASHGSAKTVFSWQGRKETTAEHKKPPVLGPGSVQNLTRKQ